MFSTMQDVPLTVARILGHGASIHGRSTVTTWTGNDPQVRSFAEVGARAAQLAYALRDELDATPDTVIGTLMWNNAEHLEAYLAVPAMGSVLHTLNLRLPAAQLAFIIDHAADHAIIVNGSVLPLLAGVLPRLSPTLKHIVVSGPGDRSLLAASRRRARLRGAAGRPPHRLPVAGGAGRAPPGDDLLHLRHHR